MTFSEMTKKFGYLMAMDILMAVEKMARIEVDAARKKMPEEKRLVTALAELDRIKPIDQAEYRRIKQEEFLNRQDSLR